MDNSAGLYSKALEMLLAGELPAAKYAWAPDPENTTRVFICCDGSLSPVFWLDKSYWDDVRDGKARVVINCGNSEFDLTEPLKACPRISTDQEANFAALVRMVSYR